MASPPTSRVVAVLDLLASAPTGLSASSIAKSLGLSGSTAATILTTLHEAAYVERLPDKTYQLGTGLLRLFEGLRTSHPMLGVAYEELERLSAAVRCGSTLARIGSEDVEIIQSAGSIAEFHNPPGHRAPIYPPHGSPAVAWRSARDIDKWLTTAPQALNAKEREAMKAVLASIRRLGYAVYGVEQDVHTMIERIHGMLDVIQFDSEMLKNQVRYATVAGIWMYPSEEIAARRSKSVSFVIAPVFGADGTPRYLLTLHVMRDSVSASELDHYVGKLKETAKLLTDYIGGRLPKG